MKNKFIFKIVCFLFIGNTILAQQTPAPKQSTDYSIEGATAHIGNGTIIENSLIMFSNGKIQFVGKAEMKIARIGTVIDGKNLHVYPGFIVANSTLGLGEIDAVKATIDDEETGTMLPHIRSLIAYNAESKVVESMRPNGVLMGQITPQGGVISGTSSIVQFDAWNWEDAAIKADAGIHLNWPKSLTRGRWWMGEDAGAKPNKEYSNEVEKLKTYLLDGQRYLASSKNPKNLPFEALNGLFNGSKKLFIAAEKAKEITDAIAFCNELGIKNIVLVFSNEAYKVANLIKENNIAVIVDKSHRTPDHNDDDFDLPYRNAQLLVEKGITVCIGDTGRMSARNLPFYAGTYAAYGLGKNEALKLITLNAAKILGIDDIVGSLEVGKLATLFISEGDALDMRTNKLTHAFIEGRKISLETHQTELSDRYSKKYGIK
ncbi:amidohydrolase family protein [Lutibacter sp.]|uniref:amidohydrolase family protein n=1 Tax=Lutibacter sp. TaxID=1925666 RepID=UPI0027324304|nr:amidohydrolase family protein [Lutibacter sp.]MDP3312657.1 amidohydrolase family protein [Lutibacter sp.]